MRFFDADDEDDSQLVLIFEKSVNPAFLSCSLASTTASSALRQNFSISLQQDDNYHGHIIHAPFNRGYNEKESGCQPRGRMGFLHRFRLPL